MSVSIQLFISQDYGWEDTGDEFDTLELATAHAKHECANATYRFYNDTTGETTHPDETPFIPEPEELPPTPACPNCQSNSHWVVGRQHDERKTWNPELRCFNDKDSECVDLWVFCSNCGIDIYDSNDDQSYNDIYTFLTTTAEMEYENK